MEPEPKQSMVLSVSSLCEVSSMMLVGVSVGHQQRARYPARYLLTHCRESGNSKVLTTGRNTSSVHMPTVSGPGFLAGSQTLLLLCQMHCDGDRIEVLITCRCDRGTTTSTPRMNSAEIRYRFWCLIDKFMCAWHAKERSACLVSGRNQTSTTWI